MAEKSAILIIEDEEYIRESLTLYFEDEGYRVTAVESGEKALSLLSPGRFVLAIVDIRLSGMDGIKTIEEIKSIDPAMTNLVFTGSLDFQITADLERLGLSEDLVIYKPVSDLDIIGNKVRELGFPPDMDNAD